MNVESAPDYRAVTFSSTPGNNEQIISALKTGQKSSSVDFPVNERLTKYHRPITHRQARKEIIEAGKIKINRSTVLIMPAINSGMVSLLMRTIDFMGYHRVLVNDRYEEQLISGQAVCSNKLNRYLDLHSYKTGEEESIIKEFKDNDYRIEYSHQFLPLSAETSIQGAEEAARSHSAGKEMRLKNQPTQHRLLVIDVDVHGNDLVESQLVHLQNCVFIYKQSQEQRQTDCLSSPCLLLNKHPRINDSDYLSDKKRKRKAKRKSLDNPKVIKKFLGAYIKGQNSQIITKDKIEEIEMKLQHQHSRHSRLREDIVLILDDVSAPINQFNILLTACASGINEIQSISENIKTNENMKKIAELLKCPVTVKYGSSTETALNDLKRDGFSICAASLGSDAVPLNRVKPALKQAIVVGNERNGIKQQTSDLSDSIVTIPRNGFSQSLNVSVAAAIVTAQMSSLKAESTEDQQFISA